MKMGQDSLFKRMVCVSFTIIEGGLLLLFLMYLFFFMWASGISVDPLPFLIGILFLSLLSAVTALFVGVLITIGARLMKRDRTEKPEMKRFNTKKLWKFYLLVITLALGLNIMMQGPEPREKCILVPGLNCLDYIAPPDDRISLKVENRLGGNVVVHWFAITQKKEDGPRLRCLMALPSKENVTILDGGSVVLEFSCVGWDGVFGLRSPPLGFDFAYSFEGDAESHVGGGGLFLKNG